MRTTFFALSVLAAAIFPAATFADDARLKSLYDANEWFELRDAVQTSNASAFYRGAVAAAFNQFPEAEKNLEAAIESAPQSEPAFEARLLLIQLYMRAGRYRKTLDGIERALSQKPDDGDLKNVRALFGALSRHPEQSLVARPYSKLRYRMKGGNLFVPVTVNGRPANYLVDSGANFSLISEAEARRVGLQISDSRGATMGDSSGAAVDFRIAIAEEFTVGAVRLAHVLFLVMRDDQQPFVDLAEGERGIIGFPVMFAFEKMRWSKTGEFEINFPSRADKHLRPNMFLEGQQIFAAGEFEKSRIILFLDTGAIHTRLLPRFASDFAGVVNAAGKKGRQRVTGVGNSIEVESVTLPQFKLNVRGSEAALNSVTVLLKDTVSDLKRCHAWIGMDLLGQPGSVTLDLQDMTFAFGR